ncbi:hypothetical protein BGX27_011236 [Mortierella sp. AM989]|nr:hypothetical protein BGX27_011236 [Mortierella sp. AM989]
MSTAKSTMMMAILALFLCLSSTVAAADLYNPGSPVNCTTWGTNCDALVTSIFKNNNTFSSSSKQCNVTNLSGAQPLCNVKVICLATFLVPGNTTILPPAGNGTNSTAGTKPISSGITVATEDMTSKLLAMYDTSKCSSASIAQIATSVSALVILATIISLLSTML